MLNRLVHHLEARQADQQFLLQWLSTLHSIGYESPYFKPGYLPQKPAKKETVVEHATNDDGFFANKAPIPRKMLKRKLNRPVNLELRLKNQLEMAKSRIKDLQLKKSQAEQNLISAQRNNCKKRKFQQITSADETFSTPEKPVKKRKTTNSGSKEVTK